jgi:hypothetical protein
MGKVSDWMIEMEDDASYMTRQQFMDKHGETVVEYYDELQLKWQYDHAEPSEPDDVVDPEDDPRLDNVREILSAQILSAQILSAKSTQHCRRTIPAGHVDNQP